MLSLTAATGLRLGVFLGVFGAMGVWEALAPRRALTTAKAARWARNIGLVLLDSACVQLLIPLQAVGVAAFAERNGWGLLHCADLPALPAPVLSVLPWWDRLFDTCRPQPEAGHAGMQIGLPSFRDPGRVGFGRPLVLPFLKRAG